MEANTNANDEISLDEIIDVFKKRWKFILLPSFVAAVLVYALLSFSPKSYEAYALLKIGSVGSKPFETVEATSEVMKRLPAGTKIDEKVNSSVKYTDVGGLLEVRATAASPDEASKLVDLAVSLVLARHQMLYENAQERLNTTVKYLNEKARSMTVWSSLNDFGIEPTRVEMTTISNSRPVRTRQNAAALAVFVIITMINTLISFYLERKGAKQQ